MKRRTLTLATLAGLSALTLGACGGGGSAAPPKPAPTTCPQSVAQAPALASGAMVAGIGLHWPLSEPEAIQPGTLAVRFANGEISAEASAALAKLGAQQMSALNPQGTASFAIPESVDPRAAAATLTSMRGVIASGPVIYRQRLAACLAPCVPDDPQFSSGVILESFPAALTNQWDFFSIQMPSAWGVTEGSNTVRIAIIDTGYDLGNPDLAAKVDGSVVYDLGTGKLNTCPGASVQDKDGHGTDVSGIAAADTNDLDAVAGVGWNIHLLEARVFPYGKNPGANTQDIAAAINWAVKNGARVINLSLGSGTADPSFEEPAVAAAIKAGVIVVAAAGNDGKKTIDYPAADPGVIAVGASAYCDMATPSSKCGTMPNTLAGGHEYVASYSNFGSGLSLVAPGGDPNSAQQACTMQSCIDYLQWIDNLDSLQGPFKEQIGLFAGTSQATPHVAGAVALMVTKDASLTPALALSILTTKANNDDISDPHQGAGRLNVLKALGATP